MTVCNSSKFFAIFFGIIILICIVLGIVLLITQQNIKNAFKYAINNSEHCEYDTTKSPNCAGPSCSNDNAICTPPFKQMSKTPATEQLDNIFAKQIIDWDDIDKMAIYTANLISALERKPQIEVMEWNYQDPFFSKYGPIEFPLGKIFYNQTDNKNIFIALRGTAKGTNEWTQDLKMGQIQSPEFIGMGMIHQGFSEIFSDIVTPIMKIINNISLPIKTIVVTGHSLGASLSVLIALYLKMHNTNMKVLCLSYACPRIGDTDFANSVDAMLNDTFQIYRFTNSIDLVPNAPLAVTPNLHDNNKPYIYKHTGKEFTYTNDWRSWLWNHFLNNYIQAMGPPSMYGTL